MIKKIAVLALAAMLSVMPLTAAWAGSADAAPYAAMDGDGSTATSATPEDDADAAAPPAADPFKFACKSALLMDYDTGTALYERNADEKLPVASVTKIMTLLLCFEALDQGKYGLDDEITVSKQAAGMGGSQALLDANAKYKAGELLKTIIVASANDSSVAMAELLSGTESLFVDAMNARAEELGMKNTHFLNSTGLPASGAYTTARDVAVMSRELLRHPLFFQYSKVWMYDLQHGGGRITQLSNTNKLIRFYDGCDGIKTGSTDEAGYCLSATAKRGDSRFIAIVIGANTSAERNSAVSQMMDYAFATYKNISIYSEGDIVQSNITVWGGQINNINAVSPRKVSVLVKKGEENKVGKFVTVYDPVQAPIERGAQVGTVKIIMDGKEVAEYPLIADRDVLQAGFWSNFIKILHSIK
jgi:D-alanyl-D-alanine carboxypeptidase (penicillin-binding protein 5/6)